MADIAGVCGLSTDAAPVVSRARIYRFPGG
jgi:hypothetical protein